MIWVKSICTKPQQNTTKRDLCVSWGHYTDVTMSVMASQFTSLTIVYSTVYSGADKRKHQSSASLAFVPVTRKMFPFDDVIMDELYLLLYQFPMQVVFIYNYVMAISYQFSYCISRNFVEIRFPSERQPYINTHTETTQIICYDMKNA